MKRRRFDPETKFAVVLEGLRGETSIAELCCRSTFYRRLSKLGNRDRGSIRMREEAGLNRRLIVI